MLLLMFRFNVTTLSQPAAFVVVHVGVFVEAVYNVPCHLNESQAVNVSVEVDLSFTETVIVVVEAH